MSTVNPAAGVPVAKSPLLHRQLRPTGQIDLVTGRDGTVSWTFYASFGNKRGLCLGVATRLSNGNTCDNPASMPSLTANVEHVDGDRVFCWSTG